MYVPKSDISSQIIELKNLDDFKDHSSDFLGLRNLCSLIDLNSLCNLTGLNSSISSKKRPDPDNLIIAGNKNY